MKQVLRLAAASAPALMALAFVAMSSPASASSNEYCRKDVTSAIVSCSFATLDQCKAMSSGRGGDCFRDPYLPEAGNPNNALAYQPRARLHHNRKPIEN
ncbi:DUF3551 domain-containing protein [Bradyrhizobium sp. dw_78]|uniref:DUF3551 domain-containing protein n=1 Tax=Bradyrhizobium sp. dw_78 TaxID=2719793 RepID=UPI001BD5DF53|nr:DUF3551 domain-containing protein [Bradyrhizobium sp. dw_78]